MQLRASLLAMLLVVSCSREVAPPTATIPAARKPQQAGQPLDPLAVSARATLARAAAVAGNQEEARRQAGAIQEDFRRSIKLADPGRVVDRESARVAVRKVPGVRSVAWIDRENLLVIVDRNDARQYATIDAICIELEPLGDTLGVVVNLQSAAATNGGELEIVSRNCQLAPGDRAFMQKARQADVISPEIRAQHQAQQRAAAMAPDRTAENAESMRALEAAAPPLQHLPER